MQVRELIKILQDQPQTANVKMIISDTEKITIVIPGPIEGKQYINNNVNQITSDEQYVYLTNVIKGKIENDSRTRVNN